MIGAQFVFASILTSLIGCMPLSKEDLKTLPVEDYIKEVYQSMINGHLRQLPDEQRLELGDFLKNFEKNSLPKLIQSVTKAVDDGNLDTITALKHKVESFVSRLHLGDLLDSKMNLIRRDDEGMMPNFLSMHYGGFGK